jgi:hypothetical protein
MNGESECQILVKERKAEQERRNYRLKLLAVILK